MNAPLTGHFFFEIKRPFAPHSPRFGGQAQGPLESSVEVKQNNYIAFNKVFAVSGWSLVNVTKCRISTLI
jgi:hypothetical protein